MIRQRRSLPTEFKREAASLMLDQGYSVAEATIPKLSLILCRDTARRGIMRIHMHHAGLTQWLYQS